VSAGASPAGPVAWTRERTLGFLALVAGGAAIACAPIFVRLADVSPSASAFWRVFLAIGPLWLWAWSSTARARPGPSAGAAVAMPLGTMLGAGLFFAGNLAFWHLAITHTAIANATLEANLAPLFVTLGAWLLFGQRVKRAFVVAMIVTLAGAFLLVLPKLGGTPAGGATAGLRGDVYGIVTALFYAGYLLSLNAIARRASTARIAATATTVGAVVLLPYALVAADRFWPATAAGWWPLVGLALVAHTLGQSLIAFGLGRVPASFGSVTLLVQPLVASFYAWALLGEGMSGMQIAGGVIILAGILLARRAS
jgi:drug/metabolite transporter (DMT)-like permease